MLSIFKDAKYGAACPGLSGYNSGEKGRVVSMKKAPSSKSHRVEGRLQQDLLEFIHAVLFLRKAFVLYGRGNVMLAEALKKLRAAEEGVFAGNQAALYSPSHPTVKQYVRSEDNEGQEWRKTQGASDGRSQRPGCAHGYIRAVHRLLARRCGGRHRQAGVSRRRSSWNERDCCSCTERGYGLLR
jgi:hypothetical protein